jgi:hypothetical protein
MFCGYSSLIKEAKHFPWSDDETVFGLVVPDEMIGKTAEKLSETLGGLTVRLEQRLPDLLESGGFWSGRLLCNW